MNSIPHSIDICPGALLFHVSSEMSVDTTHRIATFVQFIDGLQDIGIFEIVPSYGSILIIYDESIISFDDLDSHCIRWWKRTLTTPMETSPPCVTIDVVYGDDFGEDLANVSQYSGLSPAEVITLHASVEYTVGAVGFSPGFTYLIGLPPELTTPRKSTPRLKVPTGSVGIGGNQTGIYALPSSGGWNLIGRSPTRLYDSLSDPPVRLKLGDRVRFRPIDTSGFPQDSHKNAEATGNGPIEVVSPGLQTTVQDLGRYGMARYGFATDGAADRASHVRANLLVGNAASLATMEITLLGPTLRFYRRLRLALAGADLGARLNDRPLLPNRAFETMPGDELTFRVGATSTGARAYLAVRGGFDVPLILGSASTNLLAEIGGWCGRTLVAGDRLEVGQRQVPSAIHTPGLQDRTELGTDQPFRIVPGPQRDRFDDATWHRLLSNTYTVGSEANRVALRLQGPSLASGNGADMLSEGIVTGSIQVTGEGQAIVMLPSHATIGGYTKIATVIPQDWDRLGQLAPGDRMTFVEFHKTASRPPIA